MLKIFSIWFVIICGTSSANACISIQRSGQQHLIVNYCEYSIIAHYASSNGMTGASGSIPPGGSELTPIPTRYSLNVQWCTYNDWESGRCKLPKD
jgi:hypothetical protein